MKTAIFYGPEDIRIEERPVPKCPAGGALLKLHGSLICGTDAKIYKNGHPKIIPPQTIGHECCGVITEIDGEYGSLKRGCRVSVQTSIPCGRCPMCLRGLFNLCDDLEAISWSYPGTFAEYLAVPQKAISTGNLLTVPDTLTDEEACLAEPLACVVNGQDLLHVVPGESVLIIGAGPIGILHAEYARLSGAGKIIIAEKAPSRLEKARQFGYDAYIDTGRESMPEAAMALTGGKGVNVVIATAPVGSIQEEAVSCAAARGRVSLFGSLPSGRSDITIDSRAVHYRELSIIGASSSGAGHMQRALDALATGRMRTDLIITHTLPLEELVKGIEMSIDGTALKVYIKNTGA